jgi:hypothetical protein
MYVTDPLIRGGHFNSMNAVCMLPSDSVTLICQTPLLSDFVDRLKCHSPVAASVRRNSLPVVAASVGVASIGRLAAA